MTSPTSAELTTTDGLTPTRLAGEACITCGTTKPPLHPVGTVTVPGDLPGVVHDYDTIACTEHLLLAVGR